MYRNRWTYAYCNALVTLGFNLITRAIWWSDEPLFSWNVPISLLIGYLVGHAMWPVWQRIDRRHKAKMAALNAKHREILANIDEFLANPSTGIEIKRHKNTEAE